MEHSLFPTISSITGQTARRAALAILALALALVGGSGRPEAKRVATDRERARHLAQPSPALRGQEALDYLKEQRIYDSLSQAMRAARYSVSWASNAPLPGGGAHEAVNAAQGLRAYFTPEGVTVMGRADGPQWRTSLELRAIGRAGQMAAVGAAEVRAQGTRASLKRSLAAQATPIEEWYENRADGLEQGFTLAKRPAGAGAEARLELEVTGELAAQAMGTGLELHGAGAHLRYDGLKSWDATGRALETRLEVKGQQVRLLVADADAVYPLTIDPTITQVKQITASDGATDDIFGRAVAVDGDTIVVGANVDTANSNFNQGAAYVFSRNQGGANNWGQVKKLTASDGTGNNQFGIAVAVDGDTIVVGAYSSNVGTNFDQGSAYVFSRNQGGANNWGEVKKLIALNGAEGDLFGVAVAVDGDTIVVGAYGDDVGTSAQGSAYVFSRNQGGANNWGEAKKLIASDGAVADQFGLAVALDGDTIVVGAFGDTVGANTNQGSAYVFSRNQAGANNWGEVKKLTASDGAAGDDFGWSVAVDGDTIVVGAWFDDVGANVDQGSAYVFSRNQGGANNWGEVKKLTALDGALDDWFGLSVSVDGDTIVAGAIFDDVGANTNQGSAYVYSRNQGGANNWGEVKKLTASNGAAFDSFGNSVAVDGDTIVIGAPAGDVGANTNQGSAYIYSGLDCNFTQQAHPIASDGAAGDNFGNAVAVDGDTIVVGADFDDVGAGDQGSAYVFSRNQGGANNWGQATKLTASDGALGDNFGISVAVDGDTIVVGAYADDVNANGAQGSAYVFSRNQGGANNWGQVTKLTANDGAADDNFGWAVAIDGDTIAVGAYRDNVGANGAQGSAYVFSRNQGGANNWGQVKKLTASDGAAGDIFGIAVAADGDTIVVGANFDDVSTNLNQGSAYVFSRNQGGANNWGQVTKLTASDGAASDDFGVAVAVDGDTIVVGADFDGVGANGVQGSAYVFSRNQGGANNWGQVKKLTASDGAASDSFGRAVAVDGDTIAVGAIVDDVGANVDQGSAYVFSRNQGGANSWGQVTKLTASDGAADDGFGQAVAVDGDAIVVGAYFDDVGANGDQGSAYVFSGVAVCTTAPTITCPANISVNNDPGQCSASVNFSVMANGDPTPTVTCAAGAMAITSPHTFPVGTTTVTCTATNGTLPNATCSFTVTVNDRQSPTITCPASIFVGTADNSAAVTYPAPTVSDNCAGVSAPTCTPASGSSFNVGTTTVTCTATDGSNNTATCSFTVTVNRVSASISDPLACTGPGNKVTVTLNISNNGNVNQNVVDTTTFTNLVGLPNTCVANVGTCTVTNAGVSYSGTLTPGQTAVVTYMAQVGDLVTPRSQVCANNSVTFNGGPAVLVTACATVTCPPPGPGGIFPTTSEASDQKAGSVLIYNIYTSGATSGNTQNTRINITNAHPLLTSFVHLFFVAEGCSIADSYICLTGNQTASFLASDLDPGTTGYIVALAVNSIGCPTSFNYLIGDEYVKFTSGHAANLGAIAFSQIAGGLPLCDGNSVTATLNFDGISYNRVPAVLALDSVGSRADGNDTLLIINRIGGNLGIGASTLSTLFGILYDDAENALSFSVSGNCQLRNSLSNNFPRTTPRFETFIPAGRTGWLKIFNQTAAIGITGSAINFNANAGASAGAFNQGHNLHHLTLTTSSYVIPIFPPSC